MEWCFTFQYEYKGKSEYLEIMFLPIFPYKIIRLDKSSLILYQNVFERQLTWINVTQDKSLFTFITEKNKC